MSKFSDKHYCQGLVNPDDLSWQSGSLGPTSKYVLVDDKHCQGLSTVTDKSFELELGWQWVVDQRKIQKYDLSEHTDLKACNEEEKCKFEETEVEEDVSLPQSLSSTTCYVSGSEKEHDPAVHLCNSLENISSEILSRKISPDLDSLRQVSILDSSLGTRDHPSKYEHFQDGAKDAPQLQSTSFTQDLESQKSTRPQIYQDNCDLPPPQSWKHSSKPISVKSHMVDRHHRVDLKISGCEADVNKNHLSSQMGTSYPALFSQTMASECSTSSRYLFSNNEIHFTEFSTHTKFFKYANHGSCDNVNTWRTDGKHACNTKQAYERLGEALCHSQTRARQAEKCASEALKEREKLSELLLREAWLARTYKCWLQTLEFENMYLKMHSQWDINVWLAKKILNSYGAFGRTAWLDQDRGPYKKHRSVWKDEHGTDWESESNILVHCTIGLAFALGLSIAGAGLMIGWSMGWMHCLLNAIPQHHDTT